MALPFYLEKKNYRPFPEPVSEYERKCNNLAGLTGRIMAFLTLYNFSKRLSGEASIRYITEHKSDLKEYVGDLESYLSWLKVKGFVKNIIEYHSKNLQELKNLEGLLKIN